MTAGRNEGARSIGDAGAAWEAVRADETIQFAPVAAAPPAPSEPSWLDAVLRWLGEMLAPLGEALGWSWPVLRWALLAFAAAALAWLAWRMLEPALGRRRRRGAGESEPAWSPAGGEALALLEDADRLAAAGRYDEAVHLLLRRSIGQIAATRPGLVEPATTARELAALDALPAGARTAFAAIAQRVERSLFALRALGADDWRTARAAYAEFALAPLAGPGAQA